jgi:hypothetical protein
MQSPRKSLDFMYLKFEILSDHPMNSGIFTNHTFDRRSGAESDQFEVILRATGHFWSESTFQNNLSRSSPSLGWAEMDDIIGRAPFFSFFEQASDRLQSRHRATQTA